MRQTLQDANGSLDRAIDVLASLGVTMKFYEVVKHIYTNEFGFGLDKQVMNMNSWSNLSKSEQDNLTGTFIEMEPAGYFQDTMDSMPGIWADWNKLNGEGTAVALDAAAAQTAMESKGGGARHSATSTRWQCRRPSRARKSSLNSVSS